MYMWRDIQENTVAYEMTAPRHREEAGFKVKRNKWWLIWRNRMRASLLLHFRETEAALPFPILAAAPAHGF